MTEGRSVEDILTDWRGAERALAETTVNTDSRRALVALIKSLREEYRVAVELREAAAEALSRDPGL